MERSLTGLSALSALPALFGLELVVELMECEQTEFDVLALLHKVGAFHVYGSSFA